MSSNRHSAFDAPRESANTRPRETVGVARKALTAREQKGQCPTLDQIRAGQASLNIGHDGEAVAYVQELLKLPVKGKYASTTIDAVMAFQALQRLTAHGLVDQVTLKELEERTASSPSANPFLQSNNDSKTTKDLTPAQFPIIIFRLTNVALKCNSNDPQHIEKRHIAKCSIRIKKNKEESFPDINIVLKIGNDGRLRFPKSEEESKTTLKLLLKGDGTETTFSISGEKPSIRRGDATFKVYDVEDKSFKTELASKGVTVFWFDDARIEVTPKDNYGWTDDYREGDKLPNGRILLKGETGAVLGALPSKASTDIEYTNPDEAPDKDPYAVKISAQARLKPDEMVMYEQQQVATLRVGILQNVLSKVRVKVWGRPEVISWGQNVPAGTAVDPPETIRHTICVDTPSNDADEDSAPLYTKQNLRALLPCDGSGKTLSQDTPSSMMVSITKSEFRNGKEIAKIRYNPVSAKIDISFMTWVVVVFDKAATDFCVLKERPWSVHVDSTSRRQQMAEVGEQRDPKYVPVVNPPFSNDYSDLKKYPEHTIVDSVNKNRVRLIKGIAPEVGAIGRGARELGAKAREAARVDEVSNPRR